MKPPCILAVGASPRQGGNTDNLLSAAAQGAESAGALVRLVQLRELDISPCLGCEACHKKGRCLTLKDDRQDLYPVIRRGSRPDFGLTHP